MRLKLRWERPRLTLETIDSASNRFQMACGAEVAPGCLRQDVPVHTAEKPVELSPSGVFTKQYVPSVVSIGNVTMVLFVCD